MITIIAGRGIRLTDETGMEDSTISKPVRKSRGWLKFSLRGLLLFIAIFGIWLGIKVNAARKQAEAVAAILKAGGSVNFDYQTIPAKPGTLGPFDIDKKATSSAPLWLCRLFGEDFFRTPVVVQLMLDKENPLKVAALQELAGITSIRKLRLDGMVEDEDLTKLEDLTVRGSKAFLRSYFRRPTRGCCATMEVASLMSSAIYTWSAIRAEAVQLRQGRRGPATSSACRCRTVCA